MCSRGVGVCVMLFAVSITLRAQLLPWPSSSFPAGIPMYEEPDPMGGGGAGGGGGQVEYDAERGQPFSRLLFGATVSTLGIGVQTGTNLGPRVDVRLFGNYTSINYNFTQSGFRIALNVGMANTGAKVDFYPLRRIPLRISPGYLYFNRNRVTAQLLAEPNATFTLNNVDYATANANPVHGTGRLLLGGNGLMATAGLGHYVSHTYKRLTFPFEGGVVFIRQPVAQFNLYGTVCNETLPHFCEPAAQFPTFATNLAAQVRSWNRRVAPFHIYPILVGGVAYSFNFPRRGGWPR